MSYFFIGGLFSYAASISYNKESNAKRSVNDDAGRIWKIAVVTSSEALHRMCDDGGKQRSARFWDESWIEKLQNMVHHSYINKRNLRDVNLTG